MSARISTLAAVQAPCEEMVVNKWPANFVYLNDVVPSIVEEVSYFSCDNFVGTRIPGYEAPRLLLTLEAAQALKKVQLELSYAGLGLKVFDAYRPQRAVDFFGAWALDATDVRMQARFYPNVPKAELFALGYLVKQSSHSRGSTVDLTIIDLESKEELDMGTCFDYFDLLSWPSAKAISAEARANRLLLRGQMLRAGFFAVEEEWWHFTLQDEPYPQHYFDFVVR